MRLPIPHAWIWVHRQADGGSHCHQAPSRTGKDFNRGDPVNLSFNNGRSNVVDTPLEIATHAKVDARNEALNLVVINLTHNGNDQSDCFRENRRIKKLWISQSA